MKVNWRRAVERQREEEHQRKLKEREDMLSKMSDEEREKYLEDERRRVNEALSTMTMIQSYLGDNPYSKL